MNENFKIEKKLGITFKNPKLLESALTHSSLRFENENLESNEILEFIGDSIMALFPENPDDAVCAAIEMQKLLNDYNKGRVKAGYRPIKIGVGLNYGKIMLGTVGSEERLSTTVIGDTVNLASRIESLSKFYNTKILITDNVFENLIVLFIGL